MNPLEFNHFSKPDLCAARRWPVFPTSRELRQFLLPHLKLATRICMAPVSGFDKLLVTTKVIRSEHICKWLFGFVAAFVLGCGGMSVPQNLAGYSSSGQDVTSKFIQDVGIVISGITVSHTFRVTNPFNENASIASDDDVRRNCGCSSLTPAIRSLLPSAETEVTVTIRTIGLVGPFAKGGHITWTAASGQKRMMKFTIEGKAQPAIEAEPAFLFFDHDDIQNGVEKEVIFRHNVPVDWGNLSAFGPADCFRITKQTVEETLMRCKVKCVLPVDVSDVKGELVSAARVAVAPLRPATTQVSELGVSATVQLRGHQAVDLAVTPKSLLFRFNEPDNYGKTRVLLQGEMLTKTEDLIEEIVADGYRVEWRILKAGSAKNSSMMVVEITICPTRNDSRERGRVLSLNFNGGKTIHIPFVTMYAPTQRNSGLPRCR